MYGMTWLVVLSIPTFGYLAVRPGVSSSRRVLAGALVLLVPVFGPLLAMLVRRTRGGKIALEPAHAEPVRRMTAGDVSRVAELPPALERLISSDSSERLSALCDLSATPDAASISMLRWTIDNGPNDVVLDAALTLEDIDLRCEARSVAAAEALAAVPTFDRAIEAADAAASRVLTGLADASLAPQLINQARDFYQLALELAPLRHFEVNESLARLELAADRPRAALDILQVMMIGLDGEVRTRIQALRDDAAFAARDFKQMSFAPRATPDTITSLVEHRARLLARNTQPGFSGREAMRRTGS